MFGVQLKDRKRFKDLMQMLVLNAAILDCASLACNDIDLCNM